MADIEQQPPVEDTPGDDVEMAESAAGAGEDTGLPEIEPEAPKLVLFAEYVHFHCTCHLQQDQSSATTIAQSISASR